MPSLADTGLRYSLNRLPLPHYICLDLHAMQYTRPMAALCERGARMTCPLTWVKNTRLLAAAVCNEFFAKSFFFGNFSAC